MRCIHDSFPLAILRQRTTGFSNNLACNSKRVLVFGGASARSMPPRHCPSHRVSRLAVPPSNVPPTIVTGADPHTSRHEGITESCCAARVVRSQRGRFQSTVRDSNQIGRGLYPHLAHHVTAIELNYCFALMQNVSAQKQLTFAKQLSQLATANMSAVTKSLALGLALMNLVGGHVLRAAVETLGAEIK
jgi:hypothetical protein